MSELKPSGSVANPVPATMITLVAPVDRTSEISWS